MHKTARASGLSIGLLTLPGSARVSGVYNDIADDIAAHFGLGGGKSAYLCSEHLR